MPSGRPLVILKARRAAAYDVGSALTKHGGGFDFQVPYVGLRVSRLHALDVSVHNLNGNHRLRRSRQTSAAKALTVSSFNCALFDFGSCSLPTMTRLSSRSASVAGVPVDKSDKAFSTFTGLA